MKSTFSAAALIPCVAASLSLAAPSAILAQDETTPAFDAEIAWTSFEKLMTESYAYLDRPGIDGSKIMAIFEPRAKAARTDEEFIDILQLLSHNFADPHLIVGPFNNDDWSIIPTSSDIYGKYSEGQFLVHEVRAESDAQSLGVPTGVEIHTINGSQPAVLIEEIMGRPIADLTAQQREFGLNIALAGKRRAKRTVTVRKSDELVTFALPAAADFARRVREKPLLETERVGSLGIIRINNALGNFDLIKPFAEAMIELNDTSEILIDLRNTPSGGNNVVASAIMGHFVTHDRPYQMHTIPWQSRVWGTPRKFVEYVGPTGQHYGGKVYVAGGRWTGSMGEGMMLGFEAIGATTIGTDLGDLLGALNNLTLDGSKAKVDLGTQALFSITGLPRADYRPYLYLERAESDGDHDPIMKYIDGFREIKTR